MEPESWLETDPIRRASYIALGAILLIVGALALWFAPDRSAGGEMGPGAGFFPAVVAGLLCIVAVVLLARVAFRRSPPPVRPSRPLYVAIVAAAIVALYFALQTWGEAPLFSFGARAGS